MLYSKLGDGRKIVVSATANPHPNYWSWNPPKPDTVTVEFLREDVEYLSNKGDTSKVLPYVEGRWKRIADAAKKALEQ